MIFLNGLLCLIGTLVGVSLALAIHPQYQEILGELFGVEPRVALGILLGGIGYLIGATFSFEFHRWFETVLPRIELRRVLWGGVGAILGMVVATLFILPILVVLSSGRISELISATPLGKVVLPVMFVLGPIFANLFLGYLGASLLTSKIDEVRDLFAANPDASGVWHEPKSFLLDTSSLIDGRIAEIWQLGVFEGALEVPRFVIQELQLLGDSSDETKRSRGQRGLEVLDDLKKAEGSRLRILDEDFEDVPLVDEKLVRLARTKPTILVTNDYNLSKIASLEGVESLSMHRLADIMRPVALPGEGLTVELVKKGKDKGQAVGYLADGTMVVVRAGQGSIGQMVAVQVEKVLQTSAGRMIFASLPARPTSLSSRQDGASEADSSQESA